jgi:hypothetical protein
MEPINIRVVRVNGEKFYNLTDLRLWLLTAALEMPIGEKREIIIEIKKALESL